MNAKKLACAPEDIDIHELWSKIDWDKCECFVQKLQARIVKAQREGRHNKVKPCNGCLPTRSTPKHWR